jgi:hypothetical protein
MVLSLTVAELLLPASFVDIVVSQYQCYKRERKEGENGYPSNLCEAVETTLVDILNNTWFDRDYINSRSRHMFFFWRENRV